MNIPENQAFIALPSFLSYAAEAKLRANMKGLSRHGGVMCWPEAIKYLSHKNTAPIAMRESVKDFRSIPQRDYELGYTYRKRFNEAIHRSGNVHGFEEKMMLCIYGLSNAIQTILARNWETVTHRQLTF